MAELRMLTIWQPWAELIARGWKDVENRTWSTKYRGRVAIHAGKHWSDRYVHATLAALVESDLIPETVRVDNMRKDRACILAVADLVDCRYAPLDVEPENPWASPGHWQFQFANVVRFEPFQWPGAQGLQMISEGVLGPRIRV